jgi:hypothetical protein
MPLALFLQDMVGTLRAASTGLMPWLDIASNEATIVERARGAFLVHWFGTRLPFEGLSLRAHIVNIAALDKQFLAAQRSVPESPGGPNLTEPLLGFAGMLTGVMVSPMGAIAGASLLLRFSELGIGVLLKALVWVALPGLLILGLVVAPAGTAVLVGGGLSLAGIGAVLALVLANRRDVRAIFDLFGALARLMNAGVILLNQLLGPREAIRNPLLRKLLDVADRLAALFAQILGAVATVVVRIGPVMQPVAETLVGLGKLASATFAALDTIISGLQDHLAELGTGGRMSFGALVARVIAVVKRQAVLIRDTLLHQLDVLIEVFSQVATTMGSALGTFADQVGVFLRELFTSHPFVKVLKAFKTQIDAIVTAFSAPPPPPPPGAPPPEPSALAPLLKALPDLPPIPTFPSTPFLPDEARLRKELGAAAVPGLNLDAIERAAAGLGSEVAPIELSAESRAAVRRAGQRPSVFARERRTLEQRYGPLDKALELNRAQLDQFREAFSVIVGRVLPPELRATAAPQLAAVLAAVDEKVYGKPHRDVDPDRLPVLDLPDNDRLRPVVKKLRLRMPGAPLGTVRRFEALLTERLQRQEYRVDAANPAVPAAGER